MSGGKSVVRSLLFASAQCRPPHFIIRVSEAQVAYAVEFRALATLIFKCLQPLVPFRRR